MSPYRRIQQQARLWHGDVVSVSEDEWREIKERPDFSEAPFSSHQLGVIFNDRKVVYVGPPPPWPELIHEMGHVFASNSLPDDSVEWDFFGWEVVLVKYLRLKFSDWVKSNRNYSITNDGEELGYLTGKQRTALFKERVEVAHHNGCVVNGVPVSIRVPQDLPAGSA